MALMSTPDRKAQKSRARTARLGRRQRDGSRLLTVTVGRRSSDYWLGEFASPLGRAFRLDKLPACFGPDATYYVLVAQNGQDNTCDCKGCTYRGHCKHLDSVVALVRSGKL